MVNSRRKEFAPRGANSFLQEFTPTEKEAKITVASSETTVKILKIGTPEIITIIVLQLEQLDFTVQHRVQKMQTE